MLLIIIWYFFHNYFWPRPQLPEIGLSSAGLEVLASFNITVSTQYTIKYTTFVQPFDACPLLPYGYSYKACYARLG